MDYIFGIAGLSNWYWALLVAFIILQLHGILYSLYLHRFAAHNSITLDSKVQHVCRLLFWLLTNQMFDPNWLKKSVTRHRLHHLFADTVGDPHCPHIYSVRELINWKLAHIPGNAHYISEEDLIKYASDIKNSNSWIDQKIYRRWPMGGWLISSVIMFGIFGIFGIIPMFFIMTYHIVAVLLAEYGTHKFPGYRLKDHAPTCRAVNMWPWAILQAGEELHANHHAHPNSAKLSYRWWEWDFGWTIIKFLEFFNLLTINQKR